MTYAHVEIKSLRRSMKPLGFTIQILAFGTVSHLVNALNRSNEKLHELDLHLEITSVSTATIALAGGPEAEAKRKDDLCQLGEILLESLVEEDL